MRIAFICNPYANVFRGGAEVQLDNTICSLRELGINVDIVSYEKTHTLKCYDLVHFFRVEQCFREVGDYLLSEKIPYVVSTIMYPDSSWHSLYYRFGSVVTKTFLGRLLTISEKINFLKSASALYPNTRHEAVMLQKITQHERIEVMPNCAEDIYFRGKEIPADLFLDKFQNICTPFILNIGRVEPRKNQLRLVLACNMLNLPLVIIGSVRDRLYWDSCLKSAQTPIHHIDQISCRETLISAYKACEVFALPSTMETPGLTAIEAALQGAKVVITQRGGTTEYFNQKVQFVNPYSVTSIKSGIEAQLSAPIIGNESIDPLFVRYADLAKLYIASYEKIISNNVR